MNSQSQPQKFANKVSVKQQASSQTPAAQEGALEEHKKKLTPSGIIASVIVAIVVAIGAFITGLSLSFAIILFVLIVVLLLAFLSGSITLGSLMNEEYHPEEQDVEGEHHDHPEYGHGDDHY